MVDARLPDQIMCKCCRSSLAVDGPSITIRKFRKEKISNRAIDQIQLVDTRNGRFSASLCPGRLNIDYFRRHQIRQDYIPECARLALLLKGNESLPLKMLLNYSFSRITFSPGNQAGQCGGEGVVSIRGWYATLCVCDLIALLLVNTTAAKPWTCSRP